MSTEVPVRFPSGNIMLEGRYFSLSGRNPAPAVVLCHPHSLYGGSMHTGVIMVLAHALIQKGIGALCFNFRGVGESGGVFSDGIGEQDDVLAALDWLGARDDVDEDMIGLAGYSFGGGVALEAACRTGYVRALALLTPATGDSAGDWTKCTAAKYILAASEDDVVPPRNIRMIFERMSEPKKLEIIEGADHFMAGFVEVVAEKMALFLERTLKR